jgi:drug/metabolite transporter (DMT)-like permease
MLAVVTFFHFAISALAGAMAIPVRAWALRRRGDAAAASSPPQGLSSQPWLDLVRILAPLGVCQLGGFLCTNLSLKFAPVAFSHTIKASECIFTAFLALVILGQRLRSAAYLALVPTAVGVALSAASEMHFDLRGLVAALGSNTFFAGRSVLSTRVLGTTALNASTLYWCARRAGARSHAYGASPCCCGGCPTPPPLAQPHKSTGARPDPDAHRRPRPHPYPYPHRNPCACFPSFGRLLCCLASIMLLPAVVAAGEPWRLVQAGNAPLLAALCACGGLHFVYNLLSFQILEITSPVTHVVLHAVRRVLLISAASLVTGQTLTPHNWAGVAIAFGGVLAYATASR